jgi:ankyrin repeat protein
MMKMLLESGADIEARDSTGQTPLGYAIWSEAEVRGEVPKGTMLAAVNFLIAHGAHVNSMDNRGDTPLHYARFQLANEVADALLKAGANPVNDNTQNRQ